MLGFLQLSCNKYTYHESEKYLFWKGLNATRPLSHPISYSRFHGFDRVWTADLVRTDTTRTTSRPDFSLHETTMKRTRCLVLRTARNSAIWRAVPYLRRERHMISAIATWPAESQRPPKSLASSRQKSACDFEIQVDCRVDHVGGVE